MSVVIDGTSGVTFNDLSLQGAAASPYVLKNRIINGAMIINQRNWTGTVVTDGTYTLDRFVAFSSVASKYSVSQNAGSVTPPTGFSNYLGVTSLAATTLAAGDYYMITQYIEGYNIADLAWGTANAKTVTLSFQVYSSLTGTFGGVVGGNNNPAYPFTYTISTANTWTTISITVAGPTTGTFNSTTGRGMNIHFGLGVGSTYSGTAGAWSSNTYYSATGAVSVVGTNGATFYITGVQLEIGSTATPFERRLFSTELANCQRYYFRKGGSSVYEMIADCIASGTTNIQGSVKLPVTMRVAPTSMDYSTLLFSDQVNAGITPSSITLITSSTGKNDGYVQGAVTGATSLRPYQLLTNNSTNGYIGFSAEL